LLYWRWQPTAVGAAAECNDGGIAGMFHRRKYGLRPIVIDFVLALALIWTAALAASIGHSRAYAGRPPVIGAGSVRTAAGASLGGLVTGAGSQASDTLHHVRTQRLQTYLLLSLAVAALVAFNLAFWRHLRRAYASPRRGTWRRG
jgi:hypothetical protein